MATNLAAQVPNTRLVVTAEVSAAQRRAGQHPHFTRDGLLVVAKQTRKDGVWESVRGTPLQARTHRAVASSACQPRACASTSCACPSLNKANAAGRWRAVVVRLLHTCHVPPPLCGQRHSALTATARRTARCQSRCRTARRSSGVSPTVPMYGSPRATATLSVCASSWSTTVGRRAGWPRDVRADDPGAKPTSADNAKYTPLHAAASYGKIDMLYVCRAMGRKLTVSGASC